jgi:23S rRNA C2498 (ribose-2'-O)-methylase RlmM
MTSGALWLRCLVAFVCGLVILLAFDRLIVQRELAVMESAATVKELDAQRFAMIIGEVERYVRQKSELQKVYDDCAQSTPQEPHHE